MRPKKRLSASAKDRWRLIGIALFLLACFSLLIVQFFRIQIVQHKRWEREAGLQHTVVVKEPFRRGVFYSNTDLKTAHPSQKVAFVIDIPKFHLFVDPKGMPPERADAICAKLCQMLQLDESQSRRARAEFDRASRSRKLAMWIPGEVKEQIHAWWRGYARDHKIARNALFFVKDYKRSYPHGKLLGQVLHTVRELRDEKTQQCIPTGGLEHVFNEALQGRPGKRLIYRSPRHAMDRGKVIDPPKNGADVYLTINHCLQAIAEEEIERGVARAEGKGGWAIMMDPHSGEILALAQYPFFDPQRYQDYFNDEELLEHTRVKALVDPYEPGSTMKAITIAIGLMANEEMKRRGRAPLFDPVEMIPTSPRRFPGRSKPISEIRAHRYLNMYMAMQKSSNVYSAAIVDRIIDALGTDWYRSVLQNIFGFGKLTGIELPGECPGLLPRPGKVHPNGTLEWSRPTPYSLAMGYNLLVNGFQMLRSYALFANGGYAVTPTLVRKIVRRCEDGTDQVLVDQTGVDRAHHRARLIDPEIVRQVVCAMKYVTKPGGAARRADINGYTQAGKTSTSEKLKGGSYSKRDHISTFLGFAPASAPRFVLLVAIDEPAYKSKPGGGGNQYGGACASPVFRRIAKRTLEYLGVDPDDPYGYPVGDPRRDREKADWIKEIDALKTLYEVWNCG